MGKITTTQRLIVEEFPDQEKWIGKMFYVINDFFRKTLAAVNGGLAFGQNITGIEKEFDFTYVSHAVSLPLKQQWSLSGKPRSVELVAAYLGASNSNKVLNPVIASIAWDFTQDNNVSITDFTTTVGSTSTVQVPTSGQRVVLRVRISP